MGVDLPQVVVARKDTNPAGKPTKVAAFGSVTVILRDVHRAQRDAILPMPTQNFLCGFWKIAASCTPFDRLYSVHRLWTKAPDVPVEPTPGRAFPCS